MLREGLGFQPWKMNICSNYGGMGDMVARLPTIKYLHETFQHVTANVYWHDYFVPLARYLVPESDRLKHLGLSDMKDADQTLALTDFNPDRLTSLALPLIDHGSLIILDRVLPAEHRRYVKAQRTAQSVYNSRFSKTVVVTTGFTAKVREWPAEEINKITAYVKSKGYIPVFLGDDKQQPLGNLQKVKANFSEEIDFSLGINLVGKTNLIEALGIMQDAECVMGVDNGLLHLASCTRTPVIWGFTSVEAKNRLPSSSYAKQGVVTPDGCYGCQSKVFAVKHDFRTCMFKDYACTKEMTAEKFIKQFNCIMEIE